MIPRLDWVRQLSLKYTRKYSEIWVKTRNKISSMSTTLGYSEVRISRLDDAFSEILELEARPEEGQ